MKGSMIPVIFISTFCGIILGGILSHNDVSGAYQKEAIARGVARYHPVTGVWEWTAPKLPEEKK